MFEQLLSLMLMQTTNSTTLRASSGASGPSDPDIVPVAKLEKDVAAEDKLADDAAKKLRSDKEKLKAAKTDLAQQLAEAAKATEETHGAAENALDPKFDKMLNGTMVETKQAKDALKNNYESILILEDDIIPIENINRRLLKIGMPRNWKIMYLGTNMADLWENSTKLNDHFYKSKKVNGTFAYALHKSAFKEVLAIMESFDGPVDWLLHRYMERVGGALCLNTPVFAPLLFESEIGKYFRGNVLSFYNKMKIDISKYSISSVVGEKDGLFIGLGTGRCGTQSLAHLFDSQDNFTVYHEKNDIAPMPTWKFDLRLIKLKLLELCCSSDSRVVGDVGMYYLPYIEWLSKNVSSLRVISLKRDMDKTVASYDKKLSGPSSNGRNHLVDHDGSFWNIDAKWDSQYPKYNDIKSLSRVPYLQRYYTEYYRETDRLGVRTFDTEDLNDRDMVSIMLDYAGVNKKNIIHPKKNRMLSK